MVVKTVKHSQLVPTVACATGPTTATATAAAAVELHVLHDIPMPAAEKDPLKLTSTNYVLGPFWAVRLHAVNYCFARGTCLSS